MDIEKLEQDLQNTLESIDELNSGIQDLKKVVSSLSKQGPHSQKNLESSSTKN